MNAIKGIINVFESNVTQELKGKDFKSYQEAQECFNSIWTETLLQIKKELPYDKQYLMDFLSYFPSILQFVEIQADYIKIPFWKRICNVLIGNVNDKQKTFKINTKGILEIGRNLLSPVNTLLIETPISTGTPDPSDTQTNDLIEIIQTSYSYTYEINDKEIADSLKRYIATRLKRIGYEVLDYEDSLIDLFDVNFEDREKIKIESPTIRNRFTKEILCKGVIFHPINKTYF